MFSCPTKIRAYSPEQLKKMAGAEYRRRGGAFELSKIEWKISAAGCDWWVMGTLDPRMPGGHFAVVIDGTTGKVKEYVPGA
jgi:hypothetical protein